MSEHKLQRDNKPDPKGVRLARETADKVGAERREKALARTAKYLNWFEEKYGACAPSDAQLQDLAQYDGVNEYPGVPTLRDIHEYQHCERRARRQRKRRLRPRVGRGAC